MYNNLLINDQNPLKESFMELKAKDVMLLLDPNDMYEAVICAFKSSGISEKFPDKKIPGQIESKMEVCAELISSAMGAKGVWISYASGDNAMGKFQTHIRRAVKAIPFNAEAKEQERAKQIEEFNHQLHIFTMIFCENIYRFKNTKHQE